MSPIGSWSRTNRPATKPQFGEHRWDWLSSATFTANLPALESVLDDIGRQPFDGVYCLGDLVDYGPFPNEVIERIRRDFEDRPVSSFQRLAGSSNADVIVFGHTHKPYTKVVDSVLFVNVGSVGKPKDGGSIRFAEADRGGDDAEPGCCNRRCVRIGWCRR
jgi:diadenosine tetraphosphatase ApaH/serine/threonine PP2A family protein phosphatase